MHASLQGSLVFRAREDLSMDDDRDHFEVSAQQQSPHSFAKGKEVTFPVFGKLECENSINTRKMTY